MEKYNTKNQVCITFDLNIISQLKYCKEDNLQDVELHKIISLCKSGGCAFDAMNFVIENFMKGKNNIGLDSFAIEDIRTFETMFPYKRFSYDRGMNIETRMKMLLEMYNSEQFKQTVQYFYETIYLLELTYLLAIIHIHFKYVKLSPKHKFEKFLEYCNDEIQAFHPCANNLAKLFYNKPELRFFKKIQKNNKQILETIENMAWDLFHLRFLEKSVQFSHEDTDIIMIPMFISKDKGLNEIRKAYQLKCLFKNLKTGECLCFYELNSIDKEYENKYFNETAIRDRMNSTHDFKDVIAKLTNLISKSVKE